MLICWAVYTLKELQDGDNMYQDEQGECTWIDSESTWPKWTLPLEIGVPGDSANMVLEWLLEVSRKRWSEEVSTAVKDGRRKDHKAHSRGHSRMHILCKTRTFISWLYSIKGPTVYPMLQSNKEWASKSSISILDKLSGSCPRDDIMWDTVKKLGSLRNRDKIMK